MAFPGERFVFLFVCFFVLFFFFFFCSFFVFLNHENIKLRLKTGTQAIFSDIYGCDSYQRMALTIATCNYEDS